MKVCHRLRHTEICIQSTVSQQQYIALKHHSCWKLKLQHWEADLSNFLVLNIIECHSCYACGVNFYVEFISTIRWTPENYCLCRHLSGINYLEQIICLIRHQHTWTNSEVKLIQLESTHRICTDILCSNPKLFQESGQRTSCSSPTTLVYNLVNTKPTQTHKINLHATGTK